MSASQVPWVCPKCRTTVATPFCGQCGERPLPAGDLTLKGVLGKIVHATTSVDGKLLRTFRLLLRHPGQPTVAYLAGDRMRYLAPFPLFVVANALFFGIQSLTGSNIFSSPLDSHLHQQDWSVFAQGLVARRLVQMKTSLELYAPIFDRSVVLYAKSLIILMVLAFAAVLPLFFLRSRRPLMAYFVFTLHLYAFLLLLFSVALLAAKAEALLGGAGLASPRVDNVLSIVNLALCGWYIHAASGPVFGASGASRVLKAAALAVVAGAIVLGYRFVLLLITLYGS